MKRKIRKIGYDIKINESDYVNIHIDTIDKDLEFVVSQINYLYDENQKIKVESKNKEEELKRSISNISHDLRTPLTSILGYIQLIKESSLSNTKREKYIKIIEGRTKNLESLISDFYDLSRLEGNDYIFNLEKTNLKSILTENIVIFYDEFIKLGINPQIDIEDDIDDMILDKNAVTRIFSNLINNILKYGEGNVEISLKNKGEFVLTEFINDAPKLKSEDVDKIFERFFIADKSRSNNSTGIGLSVTKSLVNKLGHDIEADFIDNKIKIKIKWNINNKVS